MMMVEFEFRFGAGPNFWIVASNKEDAVAKLNSGILKAVDVSVLFKPTGLYRAVDPADQMILDTETAISQLPFEMKQNDNIEWYVRSIPVPKLMPHFEDVWKYYLKTYSPGTTSHEACFTFYKELLTLLAAGTYHPSDLMKKMLHGISELRNFRQAVMQCINDVKGLRTDAISANVVYQVLDTFLKDLDKEEFEDEEDFFAKIK